MKLLIVEDDLTIRNVLRISLEAENFAVDEAEDGDRGSYLARTNDYDIILLDNVLPKKQGYQVCRDIREAGKNTPVLILSVKSDVNEKINLLNTGADDYMTKPFSFEELIARIHTLLRRPKNIESKVLKIDDLTLNRDGHEVKRGSKRIYLTRKEFMLLELLIKNKGKVLSRGLIIEGVWDMTIDPFSNTIESHIMNIRKKIKDKKGKKQIIRTVPGRGYTVANI